MPYLSQTDYVTAARQLDAMQNEAQRRRDRLALIAIQQRKTNLNRAFWGRDLRCGRD